MTVDDREFYELMQAYRWADRSPAETMATFEAVKAWIREHYVLQPGPPLFTGMQHMLDGSVALAQQPHCPLCGGGFMRFGNTWAHHCSSLMEPLPQDVTQR